VASFVAVGTAHAPFTLWDGLSFSQTYIAPKFVLGSFTQDSILTQGSILRDLGVISLIIVGGVPYCLVTEGRDCLSMPLTCTFADKKLSLVMLLISKMKLNNEFFNLIIIS